MDKQWVQHISGQGEKWEVAKEYEEEWAVQKKVVQPSFLYFPKSEFRLTNPPEQWVDVTNQCAILTGSDGCQSVEHDGGTRFVTAWNGIDYRISKIEYQYGVNKRSAFIIEKKVSG